MAQLIVPNLEKSSCRPSRARPEGPVVEAERRDMLRDAPVARRRPSSIEAALLAMPDAGDDDDLLGPDREIGGFACEPAPRTPTSSGTAERWSGPTSTSAPGSRPFPAGTSM